MKETVKICITGGHVTPALAVMEEIRARYPKWQILFIGRSFAREGDNVQSEEMRIIRSMDIPFYCINAGRITRAIHGRSLRSILKIPGGFLSAYRIISEQRPDIILSFGGYIALPVAIIGKFMGVPVITHEQTTGMGLSNRIISRIADRVCLSYPIFGKRSHGSNRTVVTGLPLRRSLFNPPKESSVTLEGQAPIIYITGGATGARSMNQLLYPIIPRLLSRFEIVHQVGTAWLGEAKKFRAGIRGDKRRRYHVFGYLDTQDHSFIMNKAVLLVGRSGANTVAEVAGLEIPAVFIPLPWSAAREQQKNAELLVREGKAILVDQEGISPSDLLESIVRFERSQSAVHRHRSNQEYDASRRVVDQIFRVLSSR